MAGYDPEFLSGFNIELPRPKTNLDVALARSDKLREGYIADYPNYSVMINGDEDKRSPALVAFMFDQDLFKKTKRKNNWRNDRRYRREDVLGSSYYSQTWNRGHMARRHTAAYGHTQQEAQRNSDETFYYTNAALQHENLNQDEWLSLEDDARDLDTHDGRVLSFNGCIYGKFDRSVTPEGEPMAKVPAGFFKVLAFLNKDEELEVQAFIQYQDKEELRDKRGSQRQGYDNVIYQVSVMEVEELTGLIFDQQLYDANPLYFNEQPDNTLKVTNTPERVEIVRKEDIVKKNEVRKVVLDDDVDVYLTAALVNPVGQDAGNEWVSITNFGVEEIDLKGWELIDRSGAKEAIKKATKLKPGEAYVHSLSTIRLNNDGDAIELYTPDSERIDFVEYQEKEVHEGRPVMFLTPATL
ncbi:DNA/RNA non-specific endonuclease [Photobacterium kasasachensis]|uniref:DNA/RNA non-specific endonuclease n=1 Tax=Photobacterium kasasachensis TaxID=2910240 RepID=UPI003D0D3CEF